MPMRVGGRVRLRTVLLAGVLLAAALAGSWLIPGLAWRGIAGGGGQARPGTGQADFPGRPPAPPISVPIPSGRSGTAGPPSPLGRLTGLLGIALILGIGILMSRNRRAIRWRVVAWGLGLQVLFAIFVLRVP